MDSRTGVAGTMSEALARLVSLDTFAAQPEDDPDDDHVGLGTRILRAPRLRLRHSKT